jgi:hypothetical protein
MSSDRSRAPRSHPADREREPRWGCIRIEGELHKLGIAVSARTIRTLQSCRIGAPLFPWPVRPCPPSADRSS